eukprot:XP_014050864.1 PREDICTED: lectin-like [Salmo salar]
MKRKWCMRIRVASDWPLPWAPNHYVSTCLLALSLLPPTLSFSLTNSLFLFPQPISPLLSHPSQTQCRSAAPGGHLVSVHNCQANDNLLCVVMKNNAKSPRIWLGGFELFQSGKFVWTDGSSWNFDAWTPGEPISRWTSREDCVEMNWSSIGKWNDHTCFTKKSYVCSFKNRV